MNQPISTDIPLRVMANLKTYPNIGMSTEKTSVNRVNSLL